MSRNMLIVLVSLILSTLVLPTRVEASREPRYFPETGKEAVHQRALDVGNGAVVLVVNLQPGYEDLPLLAYLRLGTGARVVSTYFTNGDASPGDEGGSAPVFAVSRRKEEALAATRLLDVTAFFLNIPDPGVVSSRILLETIWNRDTATTRLERMIRHFRPDVLIMAGDLRGDTLQSMRQILFSELVMKAASIAGDPSARPDSAKPGPWDVPRIYVESSWEPGAKLAAYDAIHPAWKMSYRSIASEAAREYHGLRLQRLGWITNADRRYSLIHPRGAPAPPSMLDGIPSVSPRFRSLAAFIGKITRKEVRKLRTPSLSDVARAIDSVDASLARIRRLGAEDDYRPLVGWKNGLEELRCSLLDVNVDCVVSDSLLSANQIFYVRFQSVSSRTTSGKNRVFFPRAIDHSWGINESLDHQFSLQPPQEFRVLTPGKMEYGFPGSQFGIHQPTLRTRFPYIIIHQDSIRLREFIYRGEANLQVGPRRTFEILTPIVRAIDAAPVVCRLVNISRDAFRGTMTLRDSLVNPAAKAVSLTRKDEVLTDTLFLSLRGPLPPGDYPMSVALGTDASAPIVIRSFEAIPDPAARVGLVTSMEDSPVAQAMSRLQIAWSRIDTSHSIDAPLSQFNVIVIDRDALAGIRSLDSRNSRLIEWVKNGGHLVVFPQMAYRGGSVPLASGAMFRPSPLLPPGTTVSVDTTRSLFQTPNRIGPADWNDWVVARSFGSLLIAADREASILARGAETNTPLVVDLREGKGHTTVVALDLVSQLLNIHPGAHRLLANLLTP
jgi:LmbE family N-acetylglucosaminyl deacetylase